MSLGRVYCWVPDADHPLHGRVAKEIVSLARLDTDGEGQGYLRGRHVRVRNAGMVNEPDRVSGGVRPVRLGDASPDSAGDFFFEPGRGGGRIDKVTLAEPDFRWRYVQASHFGEVNSYYHLDRIAAYIDELLGELGASPLPPVMAVVNAHHAATEIGGIRDGLRRDDRWLPFQGGHYRLPCRSYQLAELELIGPHGEIHLGPGRQLSLHGALAEAAGGRYRANASHNAGILYHEYGHHITRHTADFRANALRPPEGQNNRKTAMDEGTCDYWAATMLETPHIWAWHHRHDQGVVHPRSLVSAKTMADYDHSSGADPHENGTIWGAGLWDLRTAARMIRADGARQVDRLLLQALILVGRLTGDKFPPKIKRVCEARMDFTTGLLALLQADELLYSGLYHDLIVANFARRGLACETGSGLMKSSPHNCGLLKRVPPDEIPETADLHTSESLEAFLTELDEPAFSLVAVGDIMLGDRAKKLISEHGADYPFRATRPLLRRALIGLGNLEGPLASQAPKQDRNFSYRVNPRTAMALHAAGINVVTLANNHLLDCGREGVMETLAALAQAGVAAIGAGTNQETAHRPAIFTAEHCRVGLLGYYWNQRTSATSHLPGSAMDSGTDLAADIRALRQQVDRVVVTFHWGVPYEPEPSPDDRAKARFAVDCGADAVIGHHPHVVQPFEIYRDRPIFFSIGNFAFGSGNSRGESLLLGLRFEEGNTRVVIYPVYVKNRDLRVNYQPKVLRGNHADRVLRKLAAMSGVNGCHLVIDRGRGILDLPWRDACHTTW